MTTLSLSAHIVVIVFWAVIAALALLVIAGTLSWLDEVMDATRSRPDPLAWLSDGPQAGGMEHTSENTDLADPDYGFCLGCGAREPKEVLEQMNGYHSSECEREHTS